MFYRTTFNRNYYAAYHVVRELVETVSRRQVNIGHSAMPDHLRGRFKNNIEFRVRQLSRANPMIRNNQGKYIADIRGSIKELANLLEQAYHVRCDADYRADIQILCFDDTYSLSATTAKESRWWYKTAELQANKLLKVWTDELGQ